MFAAGKVFIVVVSLCAFAAGVFVSQTDAVSGILDAAGPALAETFAGAFPLGADYGELAAEIDLAVGAVGRESGAPDGAEKINLSDKRLGDTRVARQNTFADGDARLREKALKPAPTSSSGADLPSKSPPAGAASAASYDAFQSAPPEKININTASSEDLQKITGVGPVIAGNIIDYRNENGPFRSIEEIVNVSGVGEAKFEKMKDEITVGDVAPETPAGEVSASSSEPAIAQYEVDVLVDGGGRGIVVSNLPGIHCRPDCTENFSAGTEITLEALPDGESSFGGWSGACSGAAARCKLILSGPLSATAVFHYRAQPVDSVYADGSSGGTASAGDILISEIFYDAEGGDGGREFVELYNAGAASVDLSGWSLRRDGNSLASIGSKQEDGTIIPAAGFFLVGLNGWSGTPRADAVRFASLPNTSAEITLEDSDGSVIDSVSYSESVSPGESWERSPLTENGQFSAQPNPSPRNSEGSLSSS